VILAGLLPILFGHGAGSEVMSRIAAPMIGGMLTAPLLSMLVVPAAYLLLRRRRPVSTPASQNPKEINMRATTCALIGALTLSLAGVAAAQGIPDMSACPWRPPPSMARAKGVIKAIDLKAGALTIQHGPIPAVGWPAMTMAFKAKPTQLLTGLKVGEAVSFDTTVRGMAADVTAVRPQ